MGTQIQQIDLIQKIKAIAPVHRQHGQESEQNRCLSQSVVHAMKEAGLFRMWKPRAYNGL